MAKKRRLTTAPPKEYPRDTTTDHYMRFNSETFDIMNKCEEYDRALLHNGQCTYTHFQGNRGNDQGRGQKLQVCLSSPSIFTRAQSNRAILGIDQGESQTSSAGGYRGS